MRSASVAGEGWPWTDACNAVMSWFSGAWREIEDSGLVLVRAMLVGVWQEADGGVCRYRPVMAAAVLGIYMLRIFI